MKNIFSVLAVVFGLATATTQAQSSFTNDTDQIPPVALLKYIEVRETALEYQIFDQQIAFAPISLEVWSTAFSNNRTIESTDLSNEITPAINSIYLEENIQAPKSIKINLFGHLQGEFTAQQLMHHEPSLLGNSLLVYQF